MHKQSVIFLALFSFSAAGKSQIVLTAEQQLGELLFQDKNLSLNRNQSCSSCHSLNRVKMAGHGANVAPGFVDPDNIKKGTAISAGSIPSLTGSLNAPSAGYAAYSPLFHWDEAEGLYAGGQFWNGRERNLTEQAKQPFLNPAEMAMPGKWAVVSRLKENEDYKNRFQQVYQIDLEAVPDIKKSAVHQKTPKSVALTYHFMAKAIAAFEKSAVFNKFNSKFDYVLAGITQLTPLENKGLELFNGKANCAACHISETSTSANGRILPPLFTDYTYDNIGLPRNINIPNNPEPDWGLGGRDDILKLDPNGDEIGKHKVMSLRNIALTPPYGHNGVLTTLEQVVRFYNTRDTLGSVADNNSPGFGATGWPEPEISQNVNHDELGNLGLTVAEEAAVVAFMKTLTDDYPTWGNDPLVPPGTPSPFPLD